jgi:hypothetical protein
MATAELEGLSTQEKLEQLSELGKALLDEERLQILGLLARRSCSLNELAAELPIQRAAIVRHMQFLQHTKLVKSDDKQDTEFYALDGKMLRTLKKNLFARAEGSAERTPEEKTLSAFLRGDQLTHMPTQPAKRLLVLEWVAGHFEYGVEYPERTVNEILNRHFDDHASLRRYLVDYGFLARQGGVYRRVERTPASETVEA